MSVPSFVELAMKVAAIGSSKNFEANVRTGFLREQTKVRDAVFAVIRYLEKLDAKFPTTRHCFWLIIPPFLPCVRAELKRKKNEKRMCVTPEVRR